MNDKMDELLKQALKPDVEPGADLNEKILNGKRIETMKAKRAIPAAAVAAIAALALCPIGVYAGSKLLNKDTTVTDHAISVGNPDYIDDEAIAQDEEPVNSEILDEQLPGENDKWTSMTEKLLNGTIKNTIYKYDNFEYMLEDAEADNWFTVDYEMAYDATLTIVDMGEQYVPEKHLDAGFIYNGKTFHISMSEDTENNASDMAYSVKVGQTGNARTITNSAGIEFDLVDDVAGDEVFNTYTIIHTKEYYGDICFTDMTDEEIAEILDTVDVEMYVSYDPENPDVCPGGEE